ncbi:uncharacterized protein LOC133307528 [Gastrolobium bilobum]|uniref:uncharacterized protein LOC133307528 n=1 Tax=Gastrolobium bilobum TaxID=150636 RepID=UPI002AB0842E|nr:uncharacterized protein LOC133307528 [Gastrolobium bilobum]
MTNTRSTSGTSQMPPRQPQSQPYGMPQHQPASEQPQLEPDPVLVEVQVGEVGTQGPTPRPQLNATVAAVRQPPHSEPPNVTNMAMGAILQRLQEMENRFLTQQRMDAQRMATVEAELRTLNAEGQTRGTGGVANNRPPQQHAEGVLQNAAGTQHQNAEDLRHQNVGERPRRPDNAGEGGPRQLNAAPLEGHAQNEQNLNLGNNRNGGGPNEHQDEEANDSPFTERLMNLAIPPRFKGTRIPPYDRSQDPEAHLEAFKTEMLFNGITGPIKARIFATTLTGQAMTWITRLPRNSIDSFEDLARTFRLNFSTSRVHPMPAYALGRIRQKENESLRKYLDRFKDAALKVRGLTEAVHLHLIISGLDGDSPLARSIYKNPVNDLEGFRRRSDKYIDVEDMQKVYVESRGRSPTRRSPSRKNNKDRDQKGSKKAKDTRDKRSEDRSPRRRYDDYTPLSMARSKIWKEVAHTEMRNVERPRPLRAKFGLDKSKYCAFHDQNGHYTDDCWDLWDAIEKHVREGKLKQYIIRTQGKKNNKRKHSSRSRSRSPKREDRKDQRKDRPSKGKEVDEKDDAFPEAEFECNVISGALGGGGDSANARRRYLKEVMSVRDRPTFKEKDGEPAPPRLFFTQEELARVVPGHTDGLVITGVLVNCRVKRIFIDHGSSADIILWDAFQRMNLDEKDLKPYITELSGLMERRPLQKATST